MPKRIPEIRIKKAIRLHKRGFSIHAASKQAGVSYSCLYGHLKKLGIQTSHRMGALLAYREGKISRVDFAPFIIPSEQWKLAYLAGLIDGEGSVCLREFEKRFIPEVKIVNTDLKMIKWIFENFGGTVNYKDRSRPSHWKRAYRWSIGSIEGCHAVLKATLPFLITKKDKAKVLFKRCEQQIKEYAKIDAIIATRGEEQEVSISK